MARLFVVYGWKNKKGTSSMFMQCIVVTRTEGNDSQNDIKGIEEEREGGLRKSFPHCLNSC